MSLFHPVAVAVKSEHASRPVQWHRFRRVVEVQEFSAVWFRLGDDGVLASRENRNSVLLGRCRNRIEQTRRETGEPLRDLTPPTYIISVVVRLLFQRIIEVYGRGQLVLHLFCGYPHVVNGWIP
jgi:hypothetical protein